ncbi:unnamed protein product [Acanthoscelides obtectus]|uniref:Zinc finger PHD-type domain-containing protein n=1 Tax=Acanthoscelides obtectus TaxID=200917 RepID=A0A9P0P5K3_ACAOB|nr:unnamed protein product [Acanthoscelides obtectus]CAK1640371.1 hypothetical protein AOBTE_LOCUS11679 [Acanthoscelides obtectus]
MRNYKRKTERGKVSIDLLQRAADAVIRDGRKLKTVARELEICHMTLFRYVKKLKAGLTSTVGYYSRQVFNHDQEKTLAEYLLKCASIYFGLLPEEVRKLAYTCAIKFDMHNIPASWHRNKEAGADWFTDVGVNGPFKTYCTKAQQNWLRNNPGKTMSIYEIPGIVKIAWPVAATPNNIMNAFKKAGISPYNPDIFTDEDFAPSFVTDRPLPDTNISLLESTHNEESQLQKITDHEEPGLNCNMEGIPDIEPRPATTGPVTNQPQPGPSNIADFSNNVVIQATSRIFSPEAIKPLPKAPPRSSTATKHRIRKSAILTDTPEKNALAEEKARRVKSKTKTKGNKIEKRIGKTNSNSIDKQNCKVIGKSVSGKKNVKRKILQDDHESDSEEDSLEWYCLICCDSFSNSKPGEQWIECVKCKNWAHSKCLKSEDIHFFVCPNCDSDDEYFE